MSDVLSEALASARADWKRLVLHSAYTSALLAILYIVTAGTLNESLALEDQLVAQGKYGFVLAASADDERISASSCDELNGVPFVVSAGSLTRIDSLTTELTRGAPIPLYSGTGAVVEVLDPESAAAHNSLWLSEQAAARVGTTRDPVVVDDYGSLSFSMFNSGLRYRGDGASLAIVAERRLQADECWLVTHEDRDDAIDNYLRAAVGDGVSVRMTNMLSISDLTRDPLEEFQASAMRLEWSAILLALAVVHLFLAISDRRESSLYRLVGLRAMEITYVGLFRDVLVVTVSALSVATVFAFVSEFDSQAQKFGFRVLAAAVPFLFSASLASRLLMALRSASILTRSLH